MGQRIAAPGVTIVDDGTLPDRRGSLTVDDEGTPSGRMVMIEDGVLKGYIQDRLNARLMGVAPTGNGRRQSYAHAPMPRMTNTIMLAGQYEPEEMIRSVKHGLYAVNFGGGSVDITSGKFVFSASEAYLIEDGRITSPVKGATLIGNGPDALTKVTMVGNDLALDPGVGNLWQERAGRARRRRPADAEAGGIDGGRDSLKATRLTDPAAAGPAPPCSAARHIARSATRSPCAYRLRPRRRAASDSVDSNICTASLIVICGQAAHPCGGAGSPPPGSPSRPCHALPG